MGVAPTGWRRHQAGWRPRDDQPRGGARTAADGRRLPGALRRRAHDRWMDCRVAHGGTSTPGGLMLGAESTHKKVAPTHPHAPLIVALV
eukprot:7385143-Prymnesium_polylepis.3